MEKIIQQFLPEAKLIACHKLSGGLIHQTYKATVNLGGVLMVFVLQAFNAKTFKAPLKVMKNLQRLQSYLAQQPYPLQLAPALPTTQNEFLFSDPSDNLWRLFPFLENSESFEVPHSDAMLLEAGKAYGFFLKALKDFEISQLAITIPDFHNLPGRFQKFQYTIQQAPIARREKAAHSIQQIFNYYDQLKVDFSDLPIRVVHNDCKLSNLLFDKSTRKCIAVIDLDTVMPGYVVTDFGDMVRGMCNTSSEEEKDLAKVAFDKHRYEILKKGFLAAGRDWLTEKETDNLFNGAKYIVLEQAIRFLTDFLDGDQYYPIYYTTHNFDRASNQLKLFSSMLQQMPTD